MKSLLLVLIQLQNKIGEQGGETVKPIVNSYKHCGMIVTLFHRIKLTDLYTCITISAYRDTDGKSNVISIIPQMPSSQSPNPIKKFNKNLFR